MCHNFSVIRGALSSSQEAVWVSTEKSGSPSLYNVPLAYRLEGRIEVDALARALSVVVERHEPLRTAVLVDGDGLWASVQPSQPLEIEHLAGPITTERDLQDALTALTERPFDLARGPLIRTALIPVGTDVSVLSVVVHHIAFDGWSEAILLREVGEVYSATIEGRPPNLPGLPVSFSAYAVSQRQDLADPRFQARVRAAAATFDPPPPPLVLPWDRAPLAAHAVCAQGVVRRPLSPRLCGATRALGREARATWFMVLLAGLHALLARERGQRDQVVGTVTAGRGRPELDGLIGCFINTVPLRTAVDPGSSFRDLLRRVRTTTLAAMRDQDVPFADLLSAASPRRNPVRAPIVQSMFVLQNTPPAVASLSGLEVSRVAVTNAIAKFELMIEVEPDDAGWRVSCEYRADLFDAGTAARLLEASEHVLEDAVAHPDRPMP